MAPEITTASGVKAALDLPVRITGRGVSASVERTEIEEFPGVFRDNVMRNDPLFLPDSSRPAAEIALHALSQRRTFQ
jgi:hypothetical protein